jgi:hypothetical protein
LLVGIGGRRPEKAFGRGIDGLNLDFGIDDGHRQG